MFPLLREGISGMMEERHPIGKTPTQMSLGSKERALGSGEYLLGTFFAASREYPLSSQRAQFEEYFRVHWSAMCPCDN